MGQTDQLGRDVQNTIDTPWSLRKGRTVPSSEDVALSGGAVELEATFLYADLASSSIIAKNLDRRVAAKILKSFLATTSRLIKANSGSIVSFDGDRIMGIFLGDRKNSNAAKCALQIEYVVSHILRPKFEAKYAPVREARFAISHGVGVDTGTVLGVRAGARGNNDLIWIGRAPNLAAKLSDVRVADYGSFITGAVYDRLADDAKLGGDPRRAMWEKCSWDYLGEKIRVYRSSWYWRP